MEEMEIQDVFDILYHKLGLIIFITIFITFLGVVYSTFLLTPLYESATSIILTRPTDSSTGSTGTLTQSDVLLNQKLVGTYGQIIKSRKIADLVIQKLSLDISPEILVSDISVSSKKDTEMLEIKVSNPDAETAARIANAVAEVFAKEIVTIYKIDNVSIIDKAVPASDPYNLNLYKQIILFFVIGIVLGVTVAFLIAYFDTTVKSPEDVEKKTGLPVLAVIPIYEDK